MLWLMNECLMQGVYYPEGVVEPGGVGLGD